jgi:ribonuclease P protein component
MLRASLLLPLKKRPAFLAVAATGTKWVTPGVIVQVKPCSDGNVREAGGAESRRLGLTASKRVGNAVERNRARRRLRALAHEILPVHGATCYDYVLIARPATVTRNYAKLKDDLVTALKRLKVWQEKSF